MARSSAVRPDRRLLRTTVAIVTASLLFTVHTGTAGAGPYGLERQLNGNLEGTVSIEPGGCPGIVKATSSGTLRGSRLLGDATIEMVVCVTSTVPNDKFYGTFVIQTRIGTITGSAAIWSPDPPGGNPQEGFGELTPQTGSGMLARVKGPLALHSFSFGSYPAPVNGTLTTLAPKPNRTKSPSLATTAQRVPR